MVLHDTQEPDRMWTVTSTTTPFWASLRDSGEGKPSSGQNFEYVSGCSLYFEGEMVMILYTDSQAVANGLAKWSES